MVFSSAIFLSIFLPIVILLYLLAGQRFRNYILLLASLFFYAWGEPIAVFVMILLIVFSWFVGNKISLSENNSKKWLIVGVTANLLALFFYKYWMFFLQNLNLFTGIFHINPISIPQIALPIGISFYVFQIISYLVDVYRKVVPAQKNLFLLATYVSLFPQLIAGPIVRYETISQDLENRKLNFENIYIGLRRFVIGLAKKVLIADNMALVADTVFNSSINTIPCLFAWVGAIAYTLQIFYDFSGYSDMAIGLGRFFNFRFLENFNFPYCANSVKEFWRRWHISLSSWFRDYLYIPLGGNRKGAVRTYINCYIVFGLCGLWHGATWNFVVWGLYHGTMLVFERLGFSKVLEKLPKVITNLYVWLFAIVGWVIFRAENLTYAKDFLKVMFTGNSGLAIHSFSSALKFIDFSNIWILIIGIIFSYPWISEKYKKIKFGKLDVVLILLLFAIAYVFAMTSTFSPFIYFRF